MQRGNEGKDEEEGKGELTNGGMGRRKGGGEGEK